MRDELFSWSEEERRMYLMQRELSGHQIPRAEDSLDYYSDHGLFHVEEVMEQCTLLLQAMAPWLGRILENRDSRWAGTHLLLGAKLHDIGMCGTEAMRTLLAKTDGAYTALSGGVLSPVAFSAFGEMLDQARSSGFSCRALRDLSYWMGHRTLQMGQVKEKLCQVHEEIKREIRRTHAVVSGDWILAHKDAMRARYGPKVNTFAVSLLAALHSGSFEGSRRAVLGEGWEAEAVRAFAVSLAARHGVPWPGNEANDEVFRDVVRLAALLRLADTRRSGDRMHSIDGAALTLRLGPDSLQVVRLYGSQERVIPLTQANWILGGELCTRFGNVELSGGRFMTHRLILPQGRDPRVRDVFLNQRVRSYWHELTTSLFAPEFGMRHRLVVDVPGLSGMEAESIRAEWRTALQAWNSELSAECGEDYLTLELVSSGAADEAE